jgi:hypothetical protein
MSNINTTIAANTANSANPTTSASPVFFLNFAGGTVEPSLTSKKSNTYKNHTHFFPQTVNECQREEPLK